MFTDNQEIEPGSFYQKYVKMITTKWKTRKQADFITANYLIVRADHECLVTFFKEAAYLQFSDYPQLMFKDKSVAIDYLKKRKDVIEMITKKDCEGARNIINERWNSLLERHEQLEFILRCQELLDKMSDNHDPVGALRFAREHLSRFMFKTRARDRSIFKIMSMVTLKDPKNSTFSYLLLDEKRVRTSKKVNLLLMRETERLAAMDAFDEEDIKLDPIPDSNLYSAYMASFTMISIIGLLENMEYDVDPATEIKLLDVFPLQFHGTPSAHTRQQVQESRESNIGRHDLQ
ncbi:hypothetical protein ACOME3_003159 [Neoechinorhynchus agilis]